MHYLARSLESLGNFVRACVAVVRFHHELVVVAARVTESVVELKRHWHLWSVDTTTSVGRISKARETALVTFMPSSRRRVDGVEKGESPWRK